jgi:aminoglycoside/choline kinase family phosphotransferase
MKYPKALEGDDLSQIDGETNLIISNLVSSLLPAGYRVEKIEGDASTRQYYLIKSNFNQFILMDSSQDPAAYHNFIKLADFLRGIGLRAPQIHSQDDENYMLIEESFGSQSLNKSLQAEPDREKELYDLTIQVLVKIHESEIPQGLVKTYDETMFLTGVETFLDWYAKRQITEEDFAQARAELLAVFTTLWGQLENFRNVLVLKDYMADNIFIMDDYEGLEKICLIDFQDAVLGSPAYDLVSLLDDARRDVSPELEAFAIERYLEYSDVEPDAFEIDYHILGIQNNLRIIGAFYRLKYRDDKEKYLQFIPRMWNYVNKNLNHPTLSAVKQWFKKYGNYFG